MFRPLRLLPASLAAAAVLVVHGSAAAAPTGEQKCDASKVKAAGSAVYAESKCHAAAIAEGTNVDAECIAGAESKLSSAFGKAESGGACDTEDNLSLVQGDVDDCVTWLLASLDGEGDCLAAKMKAAGRMAAAEAKCSQKALLAGSTASSDCLAKAEAKFEAAVVKADALGACDGMASYLEDVVDNCLAALVTDSTVAQCRLDDDTWMDGVVSANGCNLLGRDTADCESARTSAGLSGYWLKFSCRVTLGRTMTAVTAASDGQPDYRSFYFDEADPCYETYAGGTHNPNEIVAQSYSVSFPLTPTTTHQTMAGTAVVGLSLNGVPIYGNFAAPGDSIFEEAETFDRCGAHPQMNGKYHYHSEPYAITNDDSNFVGVMRDGYPIYGRRDPDNSYPTLDAYGGHTGVTVDSPATPVYHYHVNAQVNPDPPYDTQYFLTKGTFYGTPGSCTGCN